MTKSIATTGPLHLDAVKDHARPVVMRPANQDLFVQTGGQVIAACRLRISLDLWLQEIGDMLQYVEEWVRQRDERVSGTWVTPRSTKTVIFVSPQGNRYDFDLTDELVALNDDLSKRFNVGQIEVLQIPLGELDCFVDPETAVQLYGSA